MALTKEQMWEAATERYIHTHKLYLDQNVSAESMFEELCCSIYGGDEWNEIRYQYCDGGSNCFFIIDGIKFNVYDLRSMRPYNRVDKETYTDVCVINCDYVEDGAMLYHIIPDAWSYGSTCDEFDEGKPVHDYFIRAAKKFIQEKHITPDMQKMED